MHTNTSDNELMVAYKSGNDTAFRALFLHYSPKLSSFLTYRLGNKNRHLVDEIFQKTWLKIHTARKSFNPNHQFSSWFYKVALNTLRDEVGSARVKLVHTELDSELRDETPSVEEQYISKEKFVELKAALSTLKEDQRMALLLSDDDGLSSKEIAGMMGISDSSARQLISRGRKAIRNHFAEKEKNEQN